MTASSKRSTCCSAARRAELGGHAGAVDIIGLNYYYNNQWIDGGMPIHLGHWLHRPLVGPARRASPARYPDLPRYIAETGTEGVFRPYWLRYVADEVRDGSRKRHRHRRSLPLPDHQPPRLGR